MIGDDQDWRDFHTEKRPCLANLLLDSRLGDGKGLYDEIRDRTEQRLTMQALDKSERGLPRRCGLTSSVRY